MDIKKHYKIIIAILIVIILISTFIIYDITAKKNINYNNNVDKINVKYFNVGYTFPYIKNNYSISSNYINNNKISYLNSTIIYPRVLPYVNSFITFGVNIHLNNVNSKYLYLDIKSKTYPEWYQTCLSNLTFINSKYINNVCEIKYKINGNNMIINDINILHINNYIVNNKYYNTSIKIELNKNFYNLFNINTIRETAIYGKVLTDNVSSIFIENNNTHNFHIVNIRNGYFYFLAKPYTEYKMYYLHNNSLNKFYYIHNGNMSKLNYLNTTSAGTSRNINLYTSLLT